MGTTWWAPRPSWAPPPPASFRARSPTSWSTKPSSSWRTRVTLRTTHPWSSWCLHHGPAPRSARVLATLWPRLVRVLSASQGRCPALSSTGNRERQSRGCGLGSHHVFYSALGRSLQEKGVEGQEAGCPGQVEEGHGEGGGRQQLVDQRQQEITRP